MTIVRTMVLTLATALIIPTAFAQEATSSNFKVKKSLSNGFGGISTSTNFTSITSGAQTVSGEATSTNFTLSTGFLYFDSFAPKSQNWEWFDDENNETPVTSLAAENTAPANVEDFNILKLRMTVAETAAIGATNAKFRLQYSTSSTFSSGISDVVERLNCAGNSGWCYANGVDTDNALITTALLSDPDPCVASVGDGCGTHNESGTSTSSFTHKKNAKTEYEFTLESAGTIPNTVYFFRLYDLTTEAAVPLNTGESYPSISTQGATLTFVIEGLPAATTTAGITTTVDTATSSVTFGTLPFGSSIIGAQRLTVSTNATHGYTTFVYERQALQNETGTPFTPVAGTNSSPASWSGGCVATSSGCFGYHPTADVLSGGSTRFAANDTYARLTTNSGVPDEISYSGGPVVNRSTDVVYRIEAHTTQEFGDYSTDVVYIVVPVF